MKYYLIGLLLFQPVEEIYNCNHPNTIGENVHLLCNWVEEDFVKLNNGNRVLRLKRENTSLYKKLSVAIEGLEVLLSDGNINGIPQKTLEEIKSYDQELPQDKSDAKEQDI